MAAEQYFTEILKRNRDTLKDYQAPPMFKDFMHMPEIPENGKIFIISCADSRIEPAEFLQLRKGEASVIRVAGGRVQEQVLRSMEIMSSIVPVGMVVVIHHTDCGGLNTTDTEISERLSARAPEHAHEVKGKYFGTFKDIGLDECIREDVEKVKAWAFLPEFAKVVGYAFHTETGELREVV